MKRLLAILVYLLGACLEVDASAASAVDLRLFPFGNHSYSIMDQWDFYLGDASEPIPLSTIAVIPKEHDFGELRHGTFHIRLKLPEAASRFSLFFPELRSASKITINGKVISEQGRLGRNSDEEIPALKPLIHQLEGDTRELDLVVQISAYSNYQFMSSSTPISIGYHKDVFEKHQAAKMRDSFVVGAIFIMAFYHFSLFALRRERIDPLLFGLFCLTIGMRTIVRSEGLLLYHLFENPDFHWHYRFEYWGINLSAVTCGYFIYVLFDKSISKTIITMSLGTSFLYALTTGILPLSMHGILLIPFEILILLTALYLVRAIAKAQPEQRDGSILMAMGFALFMLGTLNDILKNHGLLQTTTLSHIGLVLFILCQAIIISKRFSRAFTRLKEAEYEIRQLNDVLELKVKDRTQTIRIILDNVKAGFLLVGPDLKIKEGFTRSCAEIIGKDMDVGQNFLDLFDLNSRERVQFQMAIGQIFADLLPAEVCLSQVHSRVSIGPRVISLQGSIVRRDKDNVYAILFTMTDVTLLVQAERTNQINQTLLSIMQDKQAFQSFITDSLRELKAAETAWHQGDETRVRMILHTLKGNFATYGLDDIARHIHRTEDLRVIEKTHIEDIAAFIHRFIDSYQDLIGLDLDKDGNKTALVPYQAFDTLRSMLPMLRVPGEVQRVFELWIQDVKLVPARTIFGAMLTHASRVANKLGKEVDIHVSGGDVRVDPEKLGGVISNLSHMLHNSIDHGIEFPDERHPKNPRARIDLAIRRDDNHLLIRVSDDGQGLDLERIRDVAIEKNLVTPAAFDNASEQERAHYIFLPGFSTSTSVSEVSGRGVGMASLLDVVQQLGGDIEVTSRKGQGCSFDIRIPDQIAAPLVNKVA